MSSTERETMRNAEYVGDQAAEWLVRQRASDWSQEDQTALDAWLAHSPHHRAAYWRLKAGWSRTRRLAALKPGRMRPADLQTQKRSWSPLRFLAVGCGIAVFSLAGLYGWSTKKSSYETAVGQRETISLADGSQIQINTDTAISVNMSPWQRTVLLKRGEAFFKVKHDAARPFSVLVAGHRITDLGTEFAVRTSGDQLEVTLVQGHAYLETESALVQRHATDLTPGEVAIATTNSMTVTRMPAHDLTNALAWRQGKLSFSHATLAEVAAEFNRYNSTKLTISPEIADLKISGVFDAGSVGPFTNVAKFAFGLQVKKLGREIVVSRKKPSKAD